MPTDLRRAVFFDRDGTLMEDAHYCADPALVRVFPGVPEALHRLKRGRLRRLHHHQSERHRKGPDHRSAIRARCRRSSCARRAAIRLTPPTIARTRPALPSQCRKPEPGMVLAAAAEHHIDLAASYFVGDKCAGHRMRAPGGDAYRVSADRLRRGTAMRRRHLRMRWKRWRRYWPLIMRPNCLRSTPAL